MRATTLGVVLGACLTSACVETAPPHPQTVVWVNTDVPVPVLVDTLRIEVLDEDGSVRGGDVRSLSVPNVTDWPISFGVGPSVDGSPTRFRLRAFGESRIAGRNPSLLTEELDPEEPLPAFVIDRIIDVATPEDGVRHVEVLLGGACMGVPADVGAGRSCVPGGAIDEPSDAGMAELDGPLEPGVDSQAGTWDEAAGEGCSGDERPDTGLRDDDVCIPGGVFFLGDERLGTNAAAGASWASIPERLVRMSPFFIDRHEVTVGRWRRAVEEGLSVPPDDVENAIATGGICNYHPDGDNDLLPMNCLTWEAALALCEHEGRTLPGEAQWEYAASGRGEERMFPWGNDLPTCDRSVYARVGPLSAARFGRSASAPVLGAFGECQETGDGPADVGTHPGDSTRDGVLDMGGGVQEWTLDRHAALTHECWDRPVLRDPVCDAESDSHSVRGGNWAGPVAQMTVSFRPAADRAGVVIDGTAAPTFKGFGVGFRCGRPAR